MSTPPTEPPGSWGTQAAMPACVRHPDRPTGLRCTRCDRPACPECLREASVGYQCVDCVNEGRRTVRHPTTIAGGSAAPRRPVVTLTLVFLNLAIFGITAYQAHSVVHNEDSELFLNWYLGPQMVASGEWWRLFTSGFLHYGPAHIALNMFALYILGRDLEVILGRLRYSLLYVISLFGGGVSVLLFGDVGSAVAGASGAVFGLMGGTAVVVFRMRGNPGPVLGLIAVNIFLSVRLPGISLLGHLGGLVIGAIATAAMVYAPVKSRMAWQTGTLVALVLALIGLTLIRDAQFGQLICDARYGCVQIGP